jgi:hypothetical protein
MRLASLRNRTLFAAFAAALIIAGGVSNARAEDEEAEPTLDQKILRGFLSSIGLQREAPSIEYRERSPLVVPPSRDLLPPEELTVTKNPAWPVDAGEKRRKDALRAQQRKNFDSAIDDGRVLTAEEMARGRGAPRRPDGSRRTEDVDATMLKPYEMDQGVLSRLFSGKREEAAVFTREPPRTTLTEPPTGYRTPSSSQPYGLGQKAQQAAPTHQQLKDKYGTNE